MSDTNVGIRENLCIHVDVSRDNHAIRSGLHGDIASACMRVALLILALAGCDRFFPGAEGTLTLASTASTDGFTAIEVHWDAIGDDQHRIAVFPVEFPRHFLVGVDAGETDATTFLLSAWLSNGTMEAPTQAPPPGAPYASMTVDVSAGDCTQCDLTLE